MMRLLGGRHSASAAYITRVRADGGMVINAPSIDKFNRWIDAQGLRASLNVSLDSRWGVKMDGSSYVSKLYALEGSSKDAAQATGSYQPLWTSGGMLFDGSDDRLTGIRDNAATWTMFVRINHVTNTSSKYILATLRAADASKALIGVSSANLAEWYAYETGLRTYAGGAVTPTNHSLAMTYDGTTLRRYIDGTNDGSAAIAITSDFDSGFKIGCQGTEVVFYNGYIKTVLIFKAVLSAAQIAALGAL